MSSKTGGKTTPASKTPSKSPATFLAFPAKSTGAHYTSAFARDEKRSTGGKVGTSRHAFEKSAREARIAWRSGSKTLTPMQTPYGPVNLSRFPTSDPAPKVTTVKKFYKNKSVRDKYKDLSAELVNPSLTGAKRTARERGVALELLSSIENGEAPTKRRKIAEGSESNAAAKMLAISHVSEPERVFGSSKDFRAVLRSVAKGKRTFSESFEGDSPRFMMAKTPNTARRALGKGKYKKAHSSSHFRADDSDYSDSSDDDS
jgi:hypothetical protein